jgi:hypothetical protein
MGCVLVLYIESTLFTIALIALTLRRWCRCKLLGAIDGGLQRSLRKAWQGDHRVQSVAFGATRWGLWIGKRGKDHDGSWRLGWGSIWLVHCSEVVGVLHSRVENDCTWKPLLSALAGCDAMRKIALCIGCDKSDWRALG